MADNADIVRISSNAPWEPIAGYARAVRAGDFVVVSGTTATDESGSVIGVGQMYAQAKQALGNIRKALERFGLGMDRVVRTRMFVTDMGAFAEVARAHGEVFKDSRPASTLVKIGALVHPDMLIEIEADAYAAASAHRPAPRAVKSAAHKTTKRAARRETARVKKRR
ncbi:MAG: RidA family protein [Candidatus Binataceae bacterium]